MEAVHGYRWARHGIPALIAISVATVGSVQAVEVSPVATSFAAITNLRFTVVDLDLTDGIDASFAITSLDGWPPSTNHYLRSSELPESQYVIEGTWVPSTYSQVAGPLSYTSAFTRAESGWGASSSLSLDATTPARVVGGAGSATTSPGGPLWAYNMLLGPNTRVEVIFDLNVSVSLNHSMGSSGHATATAFVATLDESISVAACDSFGLRPFGESGCGSSLEPSNALVGARLDFSSGADGRGVLFSAMTSGQLEYVSAVPESSTEALLLVGLAAIFSMASLRRRR